MRAIPPAPMQTIDSAVFALALVQGVFYILLFGWIRTRGRAARVDGVIHPGILRPVNGLLAIIGLALIAGAANGAGAEELLLGFSTAAILLLGKLVRAVRGEAREADVLQAGFHATFAAAWTFAVFN